MKQTKLHLLLILSVVLILLIFASCSEKEPTVTTDGTVATETVITTTAPVTTFWPWGNTVRENLVDIKNIDEPFAEYSEENVRNALAKHYGNFEKDTDYIALVEECEDAPFDDCYFVYYVYVYKNIFIKGAYTLYIHSGKIDMIREIGSENDSYWDGNSHWELKLPYIKGEKDPSYPSEVYNIVDREFLVKALEKVTRPDISLYYGMIFQGSSHSNYAGDEWIYSVKYGFNIGFIMEEETLILEGDN